MPNTKLTLEILPKSFHILPMPRSLAKSGHTETDEGAGDAEADRGCLHKLYYALAKRPPKKVGQGKSDLGQSPRRKICKEAMKTNCRKG